MQSERERLTGELLDDLFFIETRIQYGTITELIFKAQRYDNPKRIKAVVRFGDGKQKVFAGTTIADIMSEIRREPSIRGAQG